MKIVDQLICDGFHKSESYPIDPNFISMKSIEKTRIVLPYTGELPADCTGANPRLIITPRRLERPIISFVIEDDPEQMPPDVPAEEYYFGVEAEVSEIVDLLDRFNRQQWKDTGLELKTFHRLITHNYLGWRGLMTNPHYILAIINDMSPENVAYIAKRLQREAE